jgi:hypothetical protein
MKAKIVRDDNNTIRVSYPRLMTPKDEKKGRDRIINLFLSNRNYICIADEAPGRNTVGIKREFDFNYNPFDEFVDFNGEVTLSNDG